MFELVERKITQTTEKVISRSLKSGRSPRKVAMTLARQIVEVKMEQS